MHVYPLFLNKKGWALWASSTRKRGTNFWDETGLLIVKDYSAQMLLLREGGGRGAKSSLIDHITAYHSI